MDVERQPSRNFMKDSSYAYPGIKTVAVSYIPYNKHARRSS